MMETTIMQRIGEAHRHDRLHTFSRFLFVALVTLGLLAIAQSIPSKVMAAEQLTFATPDAAVDAFVAAMAADDLERLFDIFGRQYKNELIGGDEIEFRVISACVKGAKMSANGSSSC